ncbi:gastrula zinc finger protein XlCGF57.1-like isoform X1 [Pieris brassicae]|uniref:gastrula zinc finger protein XlCGF57.1-like isoform X1 n=1 Tax=Pieris brassicae TaxID=7116 RepID=UPI001E66193C|nr:gastrula zinc finger protein XlCGF57.1-like isoform X1 [Pieris brassicae]
MDLCRCCHAEGCFHSLTELINTITYEDMLKICFDIKICHSPDNTRQYAICNRCVMKLQDAYSFKKQVLENEQRFSEYKSVLDTFPEVKFEPPSDTVPIDFVTPDGPEEDSDDDIDLSTLKKLKSKSDKRIKKEKHTEITDSEKSDYRTADIRNIVKIIVMYSTSTPFRWSYSKYMCFFCDKVFIKISDLKQHNYEHFETKLDDALKCINTETKVKLEITDLACKACPKDMLTLDDFLDHVTITHKQNFNNGVRCSIFAFRITDSEAPCPECDQNFTFFGNLLSHVYKNHLTSGPLLCDSCGKGFLTKFMLKKHIKLTHSNTEYSCQKCNQTFKTHGAYSYHRLSHKGEFPCPQCSEKFPSWYLRKRHIAFVHDKSLQISCELCSKKFVKYNSLKWHLMSVHHNDKPFSCEMCDFKCINKTYLKRHMVSHLDTRPFQCHICVKSFQRKEHLETHVRIHTNDKRFVCRECGKGFVQVTGLKVHVRAHHSKSDT